MVCYLDFCRLWFVFADNDPQACRCVVWSLQVRARAPKTSRNNTFARRARGPRTSNAKLRYFQTASPCTSQNTRPGCLERTEQPSFHWHLLPHIAMFFERSPFSILFTNSQQKNTDAYHDFSRIHVKEYLKNPAKMPCCSPVQSIERTLQKNARTYHNFSSIHVKEYRKNPAKNARVLLYRASKEDCKNALWIIYETKYTNIADFLERTMGDSSLWSRDTVPELPIVAQGAAKPPFVPPYLPAGGEFLELYVSTPPPPHPLHSHFVRRVKLPRHGNVLLFFGRPKIFGMTKKKLVLPNRKIEKPKIQERFIFLFFASLFLVIPFFSFLLQE